MSTPKKKFNANTVTFNGIYPYVSRGEKNNGIKGYINEDKKYLNPGNTISFGQDTATIFYQEKEYLTGDKIKIFIPKNIKFNKYIAHYIITTLNCSFSNFSWGSSSYNENILRKVELILPTKNREIDYQFMEDFIKAIQKLVIKDVVILTEKKINATKLIVNSKY
nr:restriction endonuclease subunit S [uncultured Clostridium sp.]